MSYFYELYRSMYLAEEARKETIHARLSFPAGIITLLAGVEAYYMQNAPLPHNLISILFLGCAGVLVLGIVRAAWFLFRALHDYDYAYIPSASAIEEHRAGLAAYYKAIDAENADASAEADIRELLSSQHIECCKINEKRNIKRLKYLHQAHRSIIFSVAVLLVSLVPFYLVYQTNPNIQKIEVVNPSKGLRDASRTSRPTSQAAPSPATESAAAEGPATEAASASNPDDQGRL